MKTRPATAADFDDIVRMGRAHFRASRNDRFMAFDESVLRSTLAGMAGGKSGLLLVAEVSGRVVGSLGAVLMTHHYASQTRGAVELWWWIEPEARGAGAGKAMAAALAAWAKEQGAAFLTMTATDATDGEAVGEMYRRNGFERVETCWTRRL